MTGKEKADEETAEGVARLPNNKNDDGDDSDDSVSSEEDDDLILEGALMRNPDISDSDDTSSEEEDDDGEEDGSADQKPAGSKRPANAAQVSNPKKKKAKQEKPSKGKGGAVTKQDKQPQTGKRKKKQKQKSSGPEIIQVEFTFCDMDEKYFHGLKTLLTSSSPLYSATSSPLSDLMIENISVGTVVSTEGDVDGNVFGFASVLNVTTYQKHDCIQTLKSICLDHCPDDRKKELQTVLSGKTKRPAGFLLHGRMVNMPLEVVEVLHQQLVLDMDWAVDNADGGEDARKALNFGAFVRIAPTYRMAQTTAYKFFDDEMFAQHAEFTFDVELPKTFGMEETPLCSVIVMTKTGHRAAMKSMADMINGAKMAEAS